MAGISGVGVGLAAGGALIVYAAITDQQILPAVKTVLKGERPPSVANEKTVATGPDSPSSGESARNVNTGNFRGDSELAHAARAYLGRPYVWGRVFDGGGGGDCSGLVYRAFRDIGYDIPRWTSWQYGAMPGLFRKDPSGPGSGDIIWYPGHVAIAVDSANMIEAPTFGVPVRIAPIRLLAIPLVPSWQALAKYRAIRSNIPNAF